MQTGAAMARNIRRTGVAVTIKGKRNPLYPVATGPTAERLAKAENHYAKGDDKRGNVVYQFHDSPLDRLYSRLAKQAKSLGSQDGLRREYTALTKYRHHWRAAGLQDSIGSADLNRVFASDPGSMSGMAKTEGQAHHRKQYRLAKQLSACCGKPGASWREFGGSADDARAAGYFGITKVSGPASQASTPCRMGDSASLPGWDQGAAGPKGEAPPRDFYPVRRMRE
jgi:hypothetical protein